MRIMFWKHELRVLRCLIYRLEIIFALVLVAINLFSGGFPEYYLFSLENSVFVRRTSTIEDNRLEERRANVDAEN